MTHSIGRICLIVMLAAWAGITAGASGKGAEKSAPRDPAPIILRDTLRPAKQKSQFAKALKMAPDTFVYDDYQSDGSSFAAVRKLRFNDTMRNVLKFDFVQADPFLHKQMRRLYFVTRPFGVSGDLRVDYRTAKEGVLVEYRIDNLYIWGRRASDRLVREILRVNTAR